MQAWPTPLNGAGLDQNLNQVAADETEKDVADDNQIIMAFFEKMSESNAKTQSIQLP